MEYFRLENGQINKYNVTIDNENLLLLRKKIIERCSRINHAEAIMKDDDVDSLINNEKYHITKKSLVNYQTEIGLYPEHIWHVSYDVYDFPWLVTAIDSILASHLEYIELIQDRFVSSNDLTRKESLQQERNSLRSKFLQKNKMNANEIALTKYRLSQVRENLRYGTILLEESASLIYYENVLQCIKMDLISSMQLDQYIEFMNMGNSKQSIYLKDTLELVKTKKTTQNK